MKKMFSKKLSLILIFAIILGGNAFLFIENVEAACRVNPESKTRPVECDTPEETDKFWEGRGNTTSASCGLMNIPQCIADAILTVPAALALLVLQLVNLLVYLGGAILNFTVQYSVIDMKDNLEAAKIDEAWRLVRDVCNMAFIFVLLYAAINTILGREKGAQKIIVNIVVVAILMNFSLFITKFVIDISNILALTFYDAIAPGSGNVSATTGIAGSLMEPLNLQSIFDIKNLSLGGTKLFVVGVMGTIFGMVAAFTLFAVAAMFIVRFVVLLFVLVLSPFAFVAYILPSGTGMGSYQTQWQNALLGQAFFAPIYFLLTWIVIFVGRGLLMNGGSLAAAIMGQQGANGEYVADPSAVGVVVKFLVMIALIITSLTIAKSWANKAGGAVATLGNWATGKAGNIPMGIASWTGRNTVGRFADARANNENLKDRAAAGSKWARLQLAAARKGQSGSFDIRGSSIGGQLNAGAPTGKGGFGGYKAAQAKAAKEYADSLKPSEETIARAEKDKNRIADPKVQERLEKERRDAAERHAANIENLKEDYEAAKRDGAIEHDLNLITQKIKDQERKLKGASGDAETYAQSKVDELKGVSDEEASKRNKKANDEINIARDAQIANDVAVVNEAAAKAKVEAKTKDKDSDPLIKVEVDLKNEMDQKTAEMEATVIPELKQQRTLELASLKLKFENAQKASQARKEQYDAEIALLQKDAEVTKEAADLRRKEITEEYEAKKQNLEGFANTADRRKEDYAQSVENSYLAQIGDYDVIAAAEIRKTKSKKKSKADEAMDAVKKIVEDDMKAKAAESTPTETPADGGGKKAA